MHVAKAFFLNSNDSSFATKATTNSSILIALIHYRHELKWIYTYPTSISSHATGAVALQEQFLICLTLQKNNIALQ